MNNDKIKIINAKTHNLKGVTVEIPRNSLTVFTGLSGSGKSSLAFDTLYAEGQRRYVESLSAYARQFLDRLGKPDVERIEGLSPAISIEQHTSLGNPRSIVATVTEIHDYLRILYGSAATAHCPKCGRAVSRQSADQIVDALLEIGNSSRKKIILLAPVVKGKKGAQESVIQYAKRNGFARLYIDGEVYAVDDIPSLDKKKAHSIDLVIDRLQIPCDKTRLVDSVELALKEGGGVLRILNVDDKSISVFSELNACIECGISFDELKSRSFSFNSPFGACPKCSGLGHLYYFDEDLVVPDKTLPLRECIHPFRRAGHNAIMYYNALLEQIAKQYKVKLTTPYKDLPTQFRKDLMHGFKDDLVLPWRSVDKPFEGVFAVLQRRLEEAQDDSTRQKYESYRSFRTCPECNGARLNAFSRSAKLFGKTIVEVMAMNINDSLRFFKSLHASNDDKGKLAGLRDIVDEIIKRLGFLVDVGLDYLTLDRSSATLSGGEMQRIRLATQIGSGLTGVLYVLDEPTIGLHPRDNERLISTLKGLRDKGNTLVVVEHDAEMIKSADWVVDLGPGAGVNGGRVSYQGSYEGLLSSGSLTGQYLTGVKAIERPEPVEISPSTKYISIAGVTEHNLKNVTAKFPIGAFSVVTGVSGSGKSTLIDKTLKCALFAEFYGRKEKPGKFKRLTGTEFIDKVVEIDQSPIGRTPRSNPATYVGFFSEIRELFAQTPSAKARGYTAGRFSFNVKGGRCEVCSGDGVRKLEMSFLPDVYITCEQCNGRRFNSETLEVTYNSRNISQVLDMSVSEACDFFAKIPSLSRKLNLLKDVGLGYMALGQSATTLSGGEAQRIKLAAELAKRSTGKTLYLLDEPTTGLHFDDVSKLMKILFSLRDQGNTIIVIEHNVDVIRSADWVVDLGPEGGEGGGNVVYQGPLKNLSSVSSSHTARYI
jgi:excinuclease ABC subunit A